ncbi:MAG: hypothetical protein ABI824_19225 [Acidobacteriota bacterium]
MAALHRRVPRPVVRLIDCTDFKPEIVTQEDLKMLETSQSASWFSARRAATLSQRITDALLRGARLEPGPLGFDREYYRAVKVKADA